MRYRSVIGCAALVIVVAGCGSPDARNFVNTERDVTVNTAFKHAQTCLLSHGAVTVKRVGAGGVVRYPDVDAPQTWSYDTSTDNATGVTLVAGESSVTDGQLVGEERKSFVACVYVFGVPNGTTNIPVPPGS
jgi:hypothetical protein